jgi:hypothetical protein
MRRFLYLVLRFILTFLWFCKAETECFHDALGSKFSKSVPHLSINVDEYVFEAAVFALLTLERVK